MLRSIYTLGVLALDVLGVAAGGNSASAHDLAVGVLAPRASSHRKPRVEDARFLPPLGGRPKETNDVKLLDIVLVATVDGKFHALNRTSGESLWSMSGTTNHGAGASTGLPAMAPLVRTNHIPDDHDDDGTPHQEQYIIEPQSGAIYVLTDPSAPLQQFPVTMSQLVDYSPFEIPGEEDGRVFVGKKETSLLVIELETGRVLRTVSSECPWEHEDEVVKSSLTEVDLDDLEDFTERQESTSTEVYIGRTGALPFCSCGAALTPISRLPRLYTHTLARPLTAPPTCAESLLLRLWPQQPGCSFPVYLPPERGRHLSPVATEWTVSLC